MNNQNKITLILISDIEKNNPSCMRSERHTTKTKENYLHSVTQKTIFLFGI